MEVLEAVRSRRSVGKVSGDVSEAEVRELIEAAILAPNHRMTEPWTFTVLTGDARQRLGDAWAPIAADNNNVSGDQREKFIEGERRKPMRAPVLVVVSSKTNADPEINDEDFAATAAAVQNMLLVAQARGLGAIWRTGGMAYNDKIKVHLGLDASDKIVAIVYLGRPDAGMPPSKPRKYDEVVRWVNGK